MERKPEWLKVPYNREAVEEVAALMKQLKLNTVCKEANCPNLGECYRKHTATFMALGANCTRNCRFCNVTCARPTPVDPEEPAHIAEAAKTLGLRHVVVTQVTRDDLPDGGASHMAQIVRALRNSCPGVTVEVLISDFKGDEEALHTVLDARPEVLNHNVEMPKELYAAIRPQANYERSLAVLSRSKQYAPDILVKTGFMVGLGETTEMIDTLLSDIARTGCDILTIGQYLQPSENHAKLQKYVSPDEFASYKEMALGKGIPYVVSTPLVRSSYRALEAVEALKKK